MVKMVKLIKRMAAVSECGYDQDGHLVVMVVHKDNRVHAVNHSPSLGTEIINTNRLNNQHFGILMPAVIIRAFFISEI